MKILFLLTATEVLRGFRKFHLYSNSNWAVTQEKNMLDYNVLIILFENQHHFENVDMLLLLEYYIQLNNKKKEIFLYLKIKLVD
jgi:hypothetical protein